MEQADTLKYLERLSGTWVGEGTGGYPTIDTFHYREALTFTPAEGKTYLHYEQRTWLMDESGKDKPSHWETGFLRILANNEIELICAQASGRVEIARGLLTPTDEGFVLDLRSTQFALDMRVEQTWRELVLRGGFLSHSLQMQTAAVAALTQHVQARLHLRD